MELTFDQIRGYFEKRLDRSIQAREKVAVLCPFHQDSSPSATIFLSGNGGFCCHGCGVKGNVFQFEMRISDCDLITARKNISEITGADASQSSAMGVLTGCYDYRRPDGSLAFQKRRYVAENGEKTFRQYRPVGNGWAPGLDQDTPRVLYNLPHVVTANLVLIAEGEKDCETLMQLSPWPNRPDLRLAATCNPEGAWRPGQSPKWLAHYSTWLAGKQVVVFEDNDDSGGTWADHVANEALKYAEGVRRVSFKNMPEKSDVSDWFEGKSIEDLRKLVTSAPRWTATETPDKRKLFAEFSDFVTTKHDQVNWMVQGVIERGSNGFVAAEPKGAKSFVTADLVISLATGTSWLDFPCLYPTKVGMVSREDNPALTGWRLRHLMQGKNLNSTELNCLDQNLYINSRAQTGSFMFDNEEEVDELISEAKNRHLEMIFFDVFNILHRADENDNAQMTEVLRKVRSIQDKCGASLGILHHFNKDARMSRITQRLRGASAIAGFAEWVIGISMIDEETRIRRMDFDLKSGALDSIHFAIDAEENSSARIYRVKVESESPQTVRKTRGVQ